MADTSDKTALIVGGAGQLGAVIVKIFKDASWTVLCCDVRSNEEADANYEIDLSISTKERAEAVGVALGALDNKLDCVVSVAGGWAGGGISDLDVFDSADRMWGMNVQSALMTGYLAANFLKEGGLLVLTGAQAGLGATPGMVGYGISKAATIQLVSSLAADGSGMPDNSTTACIMPLTLDTPQNRASMPDADFSSWTPLETVGNLILGWANGQDTPKNGALVNV